MILRQRIVVLVIGIVIFIAIIELVRRRKLREEYSWLWLLTGFIIFLLAAWRDLLNFITNLVGVTAPAFAALFFGFIFLILINIHYSIKISELTNQVKKLAQKLAILGSDVETSLEDKTERNIETQIVDERQNDAFPPK